MLLRGEMDENGHFSRLISCADFDVVVVKKRFLGHHQKFQKVHKIPLPPAQIQQNSSELILICGDLRGTF